MKQSFSLKLWTDTSRSALKKCPIWSDLKHRRIIRSSTGFIIQYLMARSQVPQVLRFTVNSSPEMRIALNLVVRWIEDGGLSAGPALKHIISSRWAEEWGFSSWCCSCIGPQTVFYNSCLLPKPVSDIFQTLDNFARPWRACGITSLVFWSIGIAWSFVGGVGDCTTLKAELPPSL